MDNATDVAVQGKMNLREAIVAANNANGNDDIYIASNVLQIELNNALPTITEGVKIFAIDPPNAPGVPIGDAPAVPAPHFVTVKRATNADDFRILKIDIAEGKSKFVEINNLNITGGKATGEDAAGDGGGIWSRNAQVDLIRTSISNCWADRNGGAIWATGDGSLFVIDNKGAGNSTIYNNAATHDGGGIYAYNIYLKLDGGAKVVENYAGFSGGGIAAVAEDYDAINLVEINDGKILANQANRGDGGGLFVSHVTGGNAPLVIMQAAAISHNTVHGFIQNGQLISGGRGGSICLLGTVTLNAAGGANVEIKANGQTSPFAIPAQPSVFYTVASAPTVNLALVVFADNYIIPII